MTIRILEKGNCYFTLRTIIEPKFDKLGKKYSYRKFSDINNENLDGKQRIQRIYTDITL